MIYIKGNFFEFFRILDLLEIKILNKKIDYKIQIC